ncbi:MAG TPA: prepilin-type N-terminal cleavage/methylation domain-containing protein [Rhodocyclaceae bacterium]|nr:prepilin-type N-terminal cleavage/methylation domain-containing protein [Rhodocyclaceae bacterium]
MARAPGYSLAEMMVVVALLSVVALVAIPVATPSTDKRLDAAAQEVIDALRFARSEALRTGACYGADFSLDPATGSRRVRVFRTDSAIPPSPVYDVRHPLDETPYDIQLVTGTTTAGVTISAATFYFQSGATLVVRDWVAFDAAGSPEYYPDASTYTAYSAAPDVSAVTLTYQGKSVQVLLDPVTGRVTRT